MKKGLLILLCLSLSLSLFGCNQPKSAEYAKEESGGSGFGVVKKSILTLSDLYFFSVNTTKSQVEASLGSPQEYMISKDGAVTYRLNDGMVLELTYQPANEKIKTAILIDSSGKKQSLFSYLVEIGVLKSAGGMNQGGNTGVGESVTDESGKPEQPAKPEQGIEQEENAFFSSKKYSLDIASKLLKEGVRREKVLTALGKPNSFSSISFKKESYLIDVYTMEDGSIYYLDYGYSREKLRAVRCVKGSSISMVFGSWAQEERPKDFQYPARAVNAFRTLKKGAKPSEIYQRFGAPDWFEGNASRYRDAYQLLDGAVLYLDFGNGHSGLSAVTLLSVEGALSPYPLR